MAQVKDILQYHTDICHTIIEGWDKEAVAKSNFGHSRFLIAQQPRQHRVTYEEDSCYVIFRLP